MSLTEEDKAHLNKLIREQETIGFMNEFRRIRMARYNALSYEDKICGANLSYRFAIEDGELTLARKHLFRAIELIIDKIESRHCLTC